MILSIIGFVLGFVIGLFLYAQILLPLVYSFPLSIYYFLKREVTIGAIFSQFVPLIIWFVVITVLAVILSLIAPAINDFLANDPGFILGQLVSITALLLNFLRPSGRSDMKSDYMQTTFARFKTKQLSQE